MSRGLFHYTTAARASLIVRDNLLRTSELPTPPYLWVSSNPTLERTSVAYWPTAAGPRWPDLPGVHQPVRFVIPDEDGRAAIPWKQVKLTYTLRRKLEAIGRKRGAFPHEWFAIPHPIAADRCRLESTDATSRWQSTDWPQIAAAFAGVEVDIVDGRLAVMV